jgi:VanZ family protein
MQKGMTSNVTEQRRYDDGVVLTAIRKDSRKWEHFKDYLEAAITASRRTRFMINTQALGSIILYIALLNSWPSNWMRDRIATLADLKSDYAKRVLAHSNANLKSVDAADSNDISELRKWMIRAYGENSFSISVPGLGISFDINHAALVGGIAMSILLILLRFALIAEARCIALYFAKAQYYGEVDEAYDLLSMYQVLTVPPQGLSDHVSSFTTRLTHLLVYLPATIYVIWIVFDTINVQSGSDISLSHTQARLLEGWFFMLVVISLTFEVSRRRKDLRVIWKMSASRRFGSTDGGIA